MYFTGSGKGLNFKSLRFLMLQKKQTMRKEGPQQIVCEVYASLFRSQIFRTKRKPGRSPLYPSQPPNNTQLYHPHQPHTPLCPSLPLPRVPYSAFIVQSWALYLGSTKVGATRTCAPRSATGCAPKGRSQVGHFLHCSTTAGMITKASRL